MILDDDLTIQLATGAGAGRLGVQAAVGRRLHEVSKAENLDVLTWLAIQAFSGLEWHRRAQGRPRPGLE